MRQGGLILAAGRVRSKKKKSEKKTWKKNPMQTTTSLFKHPKFRQPIKNAACNSNSNITYILGIMLTAMKNMEAGVGDIRVVASFLLKPSFQNRSQSRFGNELLGIRVNLSDKRESGSERLR